VVWGIIGKTNKTTFTINTSLLIRIPYSTNKIVITHDSFGTVCILISRTHVFSHSPLSHLFLLECSSAGLPAAGRRSATAPGPTQAVTGAQGGKGSVRAAGQGRVRSRRLFLGPREQRPPAARATPRELQGMCGARSAIHLMT
jgi:hypothetical protein